MGGFNYNGESYSFDQELINRQISFNHSEMQYMLKIERQIVPWVWLDLAGGYQMNFDSSFEVQETLRDILTVNIENTWYLRVGVFISPTDKFMQK